MDPDLPELEQEFRQSWSRYDLSRYQQFLARTDEESRTELLVRMLSAELEFYFQPPSMLARRSLPEIDVDEDDERAAPCLRLFSLRFPDLLQHQDLLMRLIVLEYALRLRHDATPPNPDSYLELCPTASTRLGSLLELTESKLHNLFESQSTEIAVSKNDLTVGESETAQSLTISPLPYNLGCFLLTRCIGRGGMGYVHAAIDLRSAAQVAVKVMRRIDAWSVYRFTEEFTWLSQLYHPHVVRLYDAFSDGDVRYFSMELVEGKTIRDWFRRFPGTDEARWESLRKVLAQLASAIHFLHTSDVVHRDIKCSNVMITPRRRAVLLDLGLAIRQSELTASASIDVDGERLIGTLQYLAPEGLCGQVLTPASDWYSFGVLLYEVMLNSYPPIKVNADATLADEKYSMESDVLRQRLENCPPDLAGLCTDLLQSNPQRRPTGASILSILGKPSVVLDRSDLSLLGRGDELRQLNEALDRSRTEHRAIVHLRGESGLGKSAIVEYWQRLIDPQQLLLISLRCYRQDHTPLRLLNLLVQYLVRLLVESTEDFWIDPLRRYARQIAWTFPQIKQLLPGSAISEPGSNPLDPDSSAARRDASLRALRSMLIEFSLHRPLAIVVDDAQWSDGDSLQALSHWFKDEEARLRGLLVLVIEEDHKSKSCVAASDDAAITTVVVTALPDDVCTQILRRMASAAGTRLSPAIQADILQRASGNPFLLIELFRAFQQAAREPIFSEERWLHSDPETSTNRRYSLLPLQAENVLQYLAVAEQPLGFHQLQMVSRIKPNELQSVLSYLDAQGWIRSYSDQQDSETEIANVKYIALILASIPLERLQRRHFRTARVLSSEVPPPWPRIAHHYWEANKRREAAACYMEAARIAAKSSAFDEALYFLDRALIDEAERSPYEQRFALRLKADCLAGMGSSSRAAELYLSLGYEVSDQEEATLLECLAGEQRIRAGELDEGLNLLRSALGQLGITPARRSWLEVAKFRVQALLPQRDRRLSQENTDVNRPFSLLEQCLTRVSTPLTFLDHRLGTKLLLRLDSIARDHGTLFDQAQVVLRSAIILSFAGRKWRHRATQRLRFGRSLARSTRLTISGATANFCMYVWSIQRGEHHRAESYARQAIRLYERSQPLAQWEIQFLNLGILGCLWQRGALLELQRLTREFRQSAESRSDSMSQFWMNVNAAILSDLSEDKPDQASQALNVAARVVSHHSFQSPRFLLWHSRVLVDAYSGEWSAAKRLLEADWSKLYSSSVLRSNHYLWLAQSLRICVDLLGLRSAGDGKSSWVRRELLADARKTILRMRQLRDNSFINFANAFDLVVEATVGNIRPQLEWSRAINALDNNHHHLMANALRWHQSLYASADEAPGLQHAAEQALRDAGCSAPTKLLNIVLPLPSTHS